MRNIFTIYSPRTDLRGKKVELRNGKIVEIPADAQRTYNARFVTYRLRRFICYQNTSRNTIASPECIMKVVK